MAFPFPFPYTFPMPLDHERLDVYQLALEFFDLADDIIESLPRGRGHLADQLSRASLSIVNNIAKGAGKFSPGDKRRYYLCHPPSPPQCWTSAFDASSSQMTCIVAASNFSSA